MIEVFIDNRKPRTFTHELGFSVTLISPTTSELQAAVRAARGDETRFRRHIAREWFTGFDGIKADGAVPDNTPESREHLMESPLVRLFVIEKLTDATAWADEGNADGASAS